MSLAELPKPSNTKIILAVDRIQVQPTMFIVTVQTLLASNLQQFHLSTKQYAIVSIEVSLVSMSKWFELARFFLNDTVNKCLLYVLICGPKRWRYSQVFRITTLLRFKKSSKFTLFYTLHLVYSALIDNTVYRMYISQNKFDWNFEQGI